MSKGRQMSPKRKPVAPKTVPSGKRIGVVTPAYNQPKLVLEAIHSVGDQDCLDEVVHCVVADGGKLGSQSLHLRTCSRQYDHLHVIWSPNSGPGAARNLGIDYLLENYPDLEAIFFLDADNRLEPWGLGVAYQELMGNDADWVYSDIHMFGVNEQHTVNGRFNPYILRYQNYCDTASMVRADLLRRGIRFNPSREDGFEDWGFWLSASESGAKGHYVEDFGFRYRRRGASRFLEEADNHDAIMGLFKKKNKKAFSFAEVKQLENEHAARFCVSFNDSNAFRFVSDPFAEAPVQTFSELRNLFWQFADRRDAVEFPPYIVFVNPDLMKRSSLRPWVRDMFLRANYCMRKDATFVAHIEKEKTGFKVSRVKDTLPEQAFCVFAAVRTEVVLDVLLNDAEEWLFSLLRQPEKGTHFVYSVDVRKQWLDGIVSSRSDISAIANISGLKSLLRAASCAVNWNWKISDISRHLPDYAGWGEDLDPYCLPDLKDANRPRIGFVIKICDFGGAEKVIYNVARELAALGWQVDLFMFGNNAAQSPNEHLMCFDNIYVFDESYLNDAPLPEWGSQLKFRGETFPSHSVNNNLLNALFGMDAVINAHSWAFNSYASELRKAGVVTGTYLHLVDQSPSGRPVGHPYVSLAFEHAYDVILSCSQTLKDWLGANGVPDEKLCFIQNAPGYNLQGDVAQREVPEIPRKLRVLFAGRMDRQKGIDRLEATYKETAEHFEWRVIGKFILEQGGATFPNLLDPIYDEAELQKQYEWADVMVLLSDFEGVPLAILEAQRAGCVVVATDVGGVSEIITHGEDGYLLPIDSAVEQGIEILRDLSEDFGKVVHLGNAASQRVMTHGWTENVKPFAQLLKELVK